MFYTFLYKMLMHFMVNFPFIIANIVFICISYVYYTDYLLLFFSDHLQYTLFSQHNLSLNSMFYLKRILPRYFELIGIITFILFSLGELLLYISLYRVFFSDPGYLPTPIQLECQDFQDCNSTLNRKFSRKDTSITINSSSFNENDQLNPKAKNSSTNLSPKISNVYNRLDQISEYGPLTFTEYHLIQKTLEQAFCIDIQTDSKKKTDENYSQISNSYNGLSPLANQIEETRIPLCAKCLRWKPERAHHCRQCNKCVLKMDHHCPWVANCIGLHNYKYFLLTLIYAFSLSSLVFFTFWESLFVMYMSRTVSLNHCVWSTFAYICNFILWLFSGYLTVSHMKLVTINKTTIEYSDEIRFAQQQNNSNANKGKPCDDNNNVSCITEYSKYDKGTLNNLKEVFGNSIFIWGLPFCSPIDKDQ